jgi:hypothetical protein
MQILLVFPQHPIPKRRVINTYHYAPNMHTLGIAINDCILASRVDAFQVLVGDKIFKVSGFSGTIYLVWCKRVNQSNRNEQTNSYATMMPAICEMDGNGRGKHFVLLDSTNGKAKDLPLLQLRVFTPFKTLIWSCERPPPKEPAPFIATYNEDETLNRATASIMDVTVKIPNLVPVEATDSDGEEGDQLKFVSETPRVANPLD